VLGRFFAPAEGPFADALRETRVGVWGLDAARAHILPGARLGGVDLGENGAEMVYDAEPVSTSLARMRADDVVLKPQRDGDGNNVYHGAVPGFLGALPARERAAWIAMELTRVPRGAGTYLVRSYDDRYQATFNSTSLDAASSELSA
jgi:hypothetical protein